MSVAASFMRLNMDYGQYNAKVCMFPGSSCCNILVASPPLSFVKVNVDAHITHVNGVSLGVVIRDEVGCIKAAGVRRLTTNWEPEVAKARDARFGVEVARRPGYNRVVLECDA